jgi:hypothetical protein
LLARGWPKTDGQEREKMAGNVSGGTGSSNENWRPLLRGNGDDKGGDAKTKKG